MKKNKKETRRHTRLISGAQIHAYTTTYSWSTVTGFVFRQMELAISIPFKL